MARGCNGGSAGALLVGLGALVPLASPAKQERFWYDFPSAASASWRGHDLGLELRPLRRVRPRSTSPGPAASLRSGHDARRWR